MMNIHRDFIAFVFLLAVVSPVIAHTICEGSFTIVADKEEFSGPYVHYSGKVQLNTGSFAVEDADKLVMKIQGFTGTIYISNAIFKIVSGQKIIRIFSNISVFHMNKCVIDFYGNVKFSSNGISWGHCNVRYFINKNKVNPLSNYNP